MSTGPKTAPVKAGRITFDSGRGSAFSVAAWSFDTPIEPLTDYVRRAVIAAVAEVFTVLVEEPPFVTESTRGDGRPRLNPLHLRVCLSEHITTDGDLPYFDIDVGELIDRWTDTFYFDTADLEQLAIWLETRTAQVQAALAQQRAEEQERDGG